MARLPRIPKPRPSLTPDESAGEVIVLSHGSEFSRIYFAGGSHPSDWNRFRRYGPTSARFDHHLPPVGSSIDRAIWYAGATLKSAVAEVFQDGVIDTLSGEPYFAIARLARPVRFLSLRSNWPTRAGASQALAAGQHASARGWSIAIYEDLADIEGIEFASSMNWEGVNYVLYERAEEAFEASPVVNVPLTHRGLRAVLRNIAVELNFELVLPAAPTIATIVTLTGGGGGPLGRSPRRRTRRTP